MPSASAAVPGWRPRVCRTTSSPRRLGAYAAGLAEIASRRPVPGGAGPNGQRIRRKSNFTPPGKLADPGNWQKPTLHSSAITRKVVADGTDPSGGESRNFASLLCLPCIVSVPLHGLFPGVRHVKMLGPGEEGPTRPGFRRGRVRAPRYLRIQGIFPLGQCPTANGYCSFMAEAMGSYQ